MAVISVIDDDFAVEPLVDWLGFAGHTVTRYTSAENAMSNIESIAASGLIVLDIMMARPDAMSEKLSLNGHRTGLVLAQAIRARSPSVPIVIYSGTQDTFVLDWCEQQTNLTFVSKLSGIRLKDITERLETLLEGEPAKHIQRAFIVHGHDEKTKLEVKNYLQNTLHLPEPVILHEQPSLGRTVIEKFEDFANVSDIAFVLLTPDDQVAPAGETNDQKRRARQNVIFELGYFMGALGRASGRVYLLYKGPLELPSDLNGIVYVDISNGIESAGENLRRELRHVL